MKYRPDIDGLRAVAVVPVVLYHAGISGFSGGFVGVDVFFVISGYLITRILHDEMREGRFSILSFYERRARRILPALFAVMLFCLIAGWFLLAPADYDHMGRSAVSALIFVSNIWFWQNSGDYFQSATDFLPLLHTWSLAVEEQFYIIFPLLLMVLVRFGKRATFVFTLLLVLASFVLAMWASPRAQSASFYLLPSRIWELGIGSLLALGLGSIALPRWMRELLALAGIAGILFAVTMYDSKTVFPGLAAAPPVLGTAALIWAGSSGSTFVGRLLSWRPVVFVGLLSYSLYLWHWPIMAFARNRLMTVELPPLWQAATILLAFFAAFLSLRFVEQPFRGKKRGFSIGQGGIFAMSGIVTAALAGVSIAIVTSNGTQNRFTPEELSLLAVVEQQPEIRNCRGTRSPEQFCTFGDSNASHKWLLWGDSHAEAIQPAVDQLARTKGRALDFASEPGCAPLTGHPGLFAKQSRQQQCLRFNERVANYAIESGAYDTVFIHARWTEYARKTRNTGEDENFFTAIRDATSNSVEDDAEALDLFAETLNEMVSALAKAGIRVVILGPVPEQSQDVGQRLKGAVLYGTKMPEPISVEQVNKQQARSTALLHETAQQNGAQLIQITPTLCSDTCPTHDAMTPFYRDNNHLTRLAARTLITPILNDAFAKNIEPRETSE